MCSCNISDSIYRAYDKNLCSPVCRIDFLKNYKLNTNFELEKKYKSCRFQQTNNKLQYKNKNNSYPTELYKSDNYSILKDELIHKYTYNNPKIQKPINCKHKSTEYNRVGCIEISNNNYLYAMFSALFKNILLY
jgi:hypothetical protein